MGKMKTILNGVIAKKKKKKIWNNNDKTSIINK